MGKQLVGWLEDVAVVSCPVGMQGAAFISDLEVSTEDSSVGFADDAKLGDTFHSRRVGWRDRPAWMLLLEDGNKAVLPYIRGCDTKCTDLSQLPPVPIFTAQLYL